jgi:predicted TIM-barrel fold metal-dependent hydrolase
VAEFCAADRNRLVGLAVLPTHDPASALRELNRASELGLRGAMFEFTGATLPVYDLAWDPVWAAAAERGIAISFHIMVNWRLKADDMRLRKWLMPARASISCLMLKDILAELLYCGVTTRHPKLKLVMAESSLGWIPFVLERLEFERLNYKHLREHLPKDPIAEVFRRNFYCTFQEEVIGVRLIGDIGEDNVMWASDYPHGDGSFPRSMQVVDHIFAGASADIKRKATRDNMRKLYGIA